MPSMKHQNMHLADRRVERNLRVVIRYADFSAILIC